jgi:hypothetical protein
VGEAGLLLTELLVAVNQPAGSQISQLAVNCCTQWLTARDCSSVVLQAFLRVLGPTVTSSEALGAILEAALQAFFKHTSRFFYLYDLRLSWGEQEGKFYSILSSNHRLNRHHMSINNNILINV